MYDSGLVYILYLFRSLFFDELSSRQRRRRRRRRRVVLRRCVRERVLFIGTQFSILYTSMYSPAEAATPRA
jgi:hypothetical protein